MRVLGIETTCDETAAAVVSLNEDGTGEILSNEVMSQIAQHAAYGGVVPEIAARAHVEVIDRLVERALIKANVKVAELDGIAAAAGPGLIGGVIVGLTTGKALALAARRPFIAVNHLEAHALTARLIARLDFPYLLLLVSGGHTQLVAVEGVGDYLRLGSTVDDAVGEAFDKVGKLLGLPYPGGPEIEKIAEKGNSMRFDLPRPMLGRPKPDFSLSGLRKDRAFEPKRCGRSRRLLPGGGCRYINRPLPRRSAGVPRKSRDKQCHGGGGRRCSQWRGAALPHALLRRDGAAACAAAPAFMHG
jgi:N6-L-threonylcarbamoyladenine synthase